MSARTYRWRYKCPYCRKPYAKPTLFVKHIKKCREHQNSRSH